MYKIKQVCQLTGLTEKTIRFYIEQKLITPKTEPGLHYRSYCFSDRDIEQLRDIAALRSAEFSISEIRQMLENPSAIPSLLLEKEDALAARISSMQSVQKALENLTLSERTDVSQVADAIAPRSTLRKETPVSSRNRLLWLAVYTAIFLLMGVVVAGGRLFWLVCLALAFLAGVAFPWMAVGYFLYNRRYRKLPNHAVATVVSVIPDEGVDQYWEETNWDVIRGMMTLGFFHWNWIRPDHWIPLVQFSANGETVTTAYRYGGLKHSWHPGEPLPVAWEDGKEQQVYPQKDPVIARKAWCYLAGGLLCLVIFAAFTAYWMLR